MKTLALLLTLVVPVVSACTDAPAPSAGGLAAALAQGSPATGDPEEESQDTTGPVVRRVWAGPGVDGLGSPTPDGRFLTFTDWSTGELAVRDMITGETRHLTNQEELGLGYAVLSVVSPDGERVAFDWYGESAVELKTVGLDGTDPTTLFSGVASPMAWSPDGREILALLSTGGREQIALISTADGAVRILKDVEGRSPAEMSFSRDGQGVVFDQVVDEATGQRDIFFLSLGDGRETRLLENPANDLLLGWVPNTDYILFSSDRAGTPGAWVVKVNDGTPTEEPILVWPDLWRAGPVGFTADGDFYHGVSLGRGPQVYLATMDPGSGALLSPPALLDQDRTVAKLRPVWSPDGRFLSFTKATGSSGPQAIIVRSTETGKTREIRPGVARVGITRWTPDGRDWLVIGDSEGRRAGGLFRMDVQTGDAESVRTFQSDTVFRWHDFAPDGKTVYYKAERLDESWLTALNLESGRERVLHKVDQSQWITNWIAMSPDGEELAFWKKGGDRSGALLVIPTDESQTGVQPREVLGFESEGYRYPPQGAVGWTQDGRYLLYIGWDREPSQPGTGMGQLWRIPAVGGEAEPLNLVMSAFGRIPSIHPDGRTLAIEAGGGGGAEIWVMENYLPRR